ncbi:hypothetical protein DKK79_10605 [Gilliamella apicola]|uniref:VENN motif-containing domain-containing protein n=1 Tax=Gilliamella apicola TaxID=1196095 RepID=A0A2V4DVG1_9GAMM|nr:hypothetical protein DKK79_10605 [Gilliamella apicola]
MSYHNHNEQTSSKDWGSAQLSDTEKFTGYMSSKDQYNSNNVEQIRSQVGSLNGNVNIIAGEHYTQQVADIIAANNLNIIAKDITVLDDANHGSAHQSSKDLKIGNFTKISSPLIDLANAVDTLNQSKADDRTKALQTMAALGQGYTAYSAGKNIQDASLIKIESGIGFKSSKSQQDSSYRQSQANQLTAGGNINLNSARDIILEAGHNQHKADGKNSSAGLSVGVGASIGVQTGVYIYGEAGFSSGNNHLNAQTHSQTTLQSDKLSLTSKGNTTLIGAQANANRIDANIGGKLSIISPQDQIDQKISQSGANIHVQGAAIASTAAKEHNQLTTNSLTFTDIENHSSFKASSGGAGAEAGKVAADIIRKQLYGKEVKDLTEEEKQTISALSQLASGLAVAAGGGNIGNASAAISSSKNAVENNTESMDWWREKHKDSTEYYKDKLREILGENTISQIINGALTAYGDTVDLGAGAADTVLDGVLALSSCAVGVNYCDTALNDLRKADQTVANAVNAIINGQAWDAIKDNFVKAANGDQIALENSAALLIGIITPTKGLGNVGKTEKLINKSDKVISDANKAGKLDEALSDVNKLDKEYFENQYGKNNVEQGFGDYKEIKDNINNNHSANQQANKNSNFDEHVVNEKGLANAGKGTSAAGQANSNATNTVNGTKLNAQLVGQEIAGGHAFDKHVIKQGEFEDLSITTKEQFALHIEKVVSNPTSIKELNNGRLVYWDQSIGTVVIRNPKAKDGGTAFRLTDGRQYFDDLN